MARTSICKKSISPENRTVSFIFNDNSIPLVCSIDDLLPEIQLNYLLHGIAARVGDSYAGERDPATARQIATAAWTRTIGNEPEWSASPGEAGLGELARAISTLYNYTVEETLVMLQQRDAKERAALRKNKAIKAELLRQQLAQLSDTDTADTAAEVQELFANT